MQKIEKEILSQVIKPRLKDTNKTNYGRVVIVAGNEDMGGAGLLSASACVHAGAGLVTLATDKVNRTAVHTLVPEVMFCDYTDTKRLIGLLEKADVIVVGPGLGENKHTVDLLKIALKVFDEKRQYLVIDASALASLPEADYKLNSNRIILTPHQGEWAKLSGLSLEDQTDSNNILKMQSLHATLVLKSSMTHIYYMNGEVYAILAGSPAMSTGGMGDTLTGIIAAFLGQFVCNTDMIHVLNAAVYFHSYVADQLAKNKYVVLPSDIINSLQDQMKKCIYN